MLNGLDPIIIFNFSKLIPGLTDVVNKIPILSNVSDAIGFPPVPIYLSETLTGLYIDSEDKNIDVETTVDTLPNGKEAEWKQKGLNSSIKINMLALKDSIGMILLGSMCDLIFDKVTSKEYSITYLHGSVTVFNGLLHGFSINQNSHNELYQITLELSKSTVKPKPTAGVPEVAKQTTVLLTPPTP